MLTDLELILRIKESQDQSAIIELTQRHTGIYIEIANQFSSYDKVRIDDIKDDRMDNIYRWALKYDPSRGMQFGSYVGDQTRFLCLKTLSRTPRTIEFFESETDSNEKDSAEKVSSSDLLSEAYKNALLVAKNSNPKFGRIFRMRFPSHGKGLSWRAIGKRMGLSHERVRLIYNENIEEVKKYLKT